MLAPLFLGRDFRGEYFSKEILIKQPIYAVNTFAPQNHIDADNLWTRHHGFQHGYEGATQMDYMLASLHLACRTGAQVLTLETVKDNSDHRPLLLDPRTLVQRKPNKRQWVPPNKPKFLGWRLDAEASANNSHNISNYSDHILKELDMGEFSGKSKDDWRRKL